MGGIGEVASVVWRKERLPWTSERDLDVGGSSVRGGKSDELVRVDGRDYDYTRTRGRKSQVN